MKLLEEDCPDECRNSHYVDAHLLQVRSAALALLRWSDKIPAHKQQEYDRLVRTHLNVLEEDDLSAEKLQEAINVEYRIANPNYVAGPEWVLRSLSCDAVKIEHFIKLWRQHFVTTVQPKFLPHGWSVDAPVTSNVQETAHVDR
jgi:tryptophan 2,3-dioxygenase